MCLLGDFSVPHRRPGWWPFFFSSMRRNEQRKHGGSADEQDHVWDSSTSGGGHQVQADAPGRNGVRVFEMHRDVQSRWASAITSLSISLSSVRLHKLLLSHFTALKLKLLCCTKIDLFLGTYFTVPTQGSTELRGFRNASAIAALQDEAQLTLNSYIHTR